MAGSPIAILLPYFKKYGVEMYILLGFALYFKMKRKEAKVYKNLYGEYDFQRRYTLDKIDEYVALVEKRKEHQHEVAKH